jgi:DNA replication and repair protein RecF
LPEQPKLSRLTLTDFRSYKALRFNLVAPISVFTGPNGSGKTNLLEAVSMLVPGRGLRGAKFSRMPTGGCSGWMVLPPAPRPKSPPAWPPCG